MPDSQQPSDSLHGYDETAEVSSTRIPITEIVYFESQGHYIVVHYNEKSLRFKARMSDIETALSKYFFVRCHVGLSAELPVCSNLQPDERHLDGRDRPAGQPRQS